MNRTVTHARARFGQAGLLAALVVLSIAVAPCAGAAEYDAQFSSAQYVQRIAPGTSQEIVIWMTNTGQYQWAGGWAACEVGQSGGWGIGCIWLDPVFTVGPGGTYGFRFTWQAPTTEGVYTTRWQMFAGSAIGSPSPELSIIVNGDDAGDGRVTVLTDLFASQSTSAFITMLNTGETTWTNDDYEIVNVGSTDWGVSRVQLANGPVAPGAWGNFWFQIVAPPEPGTYTFQWQMVKRGVHSFGAPTPPVSIAVAALPYEPEDAAFCGWGPVGRYKLREVVEIDVCMRNTGPRAWVAIDNYRLAIDSTNVIILGGAGGLEENVAPNSTAIFHFTVQMPWYPTSEFGEPVNVQMTHRNAPFGRRATFGIPVDLLSSEAEFVSQSAPEVVSPGAQTGVSLTLRNASQEAWELGQYELVSSNSNWGTTEVALPAAVASGEQTTIPFTVTAPATPGAYGFQWQLMHDGQPVGNPSPNVSISVVAPAVLTPGYYEETASRLRYGGTWKVWSGTGPSGDSVKYTSDPAGSVSFDFDGTGLRIYRTMTANRGPMHVCIDGDDAAHCIDVESYSALQRFKQPWNWPAPLARCVHSARISMVSSQTIDLDAVEVLKPLRPGYYEETNTNLAYSGTWGTWAGEGPSGGSIRFTDDPAGRLSFQFDGAGLAIYRTMLSSRGPMRVCVDGDDEEHCEVVANASPTTLFKQRWLWTKTVLGAGLHSASISNTSTTRFDIDGVQVLPPVPPPQTMGAGYYEENSPDLVYSGNWAVWMAYGPSADCVRRTKQLGASVSFTFEGTQMTLYRTTQPGRGAMKVCVDGDDDAHCTVVENGAEATAYQQPWTWTDPTYDYGPHSVTITNTSANLIEFDAVRVRW